MGHRFNVPDLSVFGWGFFPNGAPTKILQKRNEDCEKLIMFLDFQWDNLISLRRFFFAFTNNGTIKRARSSRILSYWKTWVEFKNEILSFKKVAFKFPWNSGIWAREKKSLARFNNKQARRLEHENAIKWEDLKTSPRGIIISSLFHCLFSGMNLIYIFFISRCLWQKENRNKVNTMAKLERKQEFR